jgi:GGDEF domain-containing protein
MDWKRLKTVLRIKVNGLEEVKNKHGQDTYENVLKTLAGTLVHNINPTDIVGEWAESEFLGIVAHGNEKKLALKANAYRILMEKSEISKGEPPVSLTVSVGTYMVKEGDTRETILRVINDG